MRFESVSDNPGSDPELIEEYYGLEIRVTVCRFFQATPIYSDTFPGLKRSNRSCSDRVFSFWPAI